MTITQLKYVLAVAKYQNFTLASQKCFVTQPTLSMQINKLEEELGVLIFNRKKKPLTPTVIGEKIIQQAKQIINESQRITDIVAVEKGYIGGDFKIGVIPTIMPTLLPLFLKTFLKRHTNVNLIIEELTTNEIVKRLNDGNLDVAIAATPLENEKIVERVLYYEPFVGFVSSKHRLFKQKKISVDELDINDILLLDDGHCFKENILNLCGSRNVQKFKNFKLQSGSFNTLIKLSKEGLGMTLLPYLQTLDLSNDNKTYLRKFKDPIPAREVSLIYHRSQLKMQIIDALKDTIDAVIRGVIAFSDVDIISPLKSKNKQIIK